MHSPPQKMMDQWLYIVEDKAAPLAVHNGLAWWNRESEEPAIAGMWDTIDELDRDIVAPKRAMAMVSAAVPTPVMTFEQRTSQAIPMSRDRQDWQVTPEEFARWNRFYQFTVDACSDAKGRNAQLGKYCSRKNSCVYNPWDGETVWCNAPFSSDQIRVSEIQRHFKLCKSRNRQTSACFILPYFPGAEWEKKLMSIDDMTLHHIYPRGSKLFFAPDGGNPTPRWPVQV